MSGMDAVDELRHWLGDCDAEKISFSRHFHERTLERPIDEELVKTTIKNLAS